MQQTVIIFSSLRKLHFDYFSSPNYLRCVMPERKDFLALFFNLNYVKKLWISINNTLFIFEDFFCSMKTGRVTHNSFLYLFISQTHETRHYKNLLLCTVVKS